MVEHGTLGDIAQGFNLFASALIVVLVAYVSWWHMRAHGLASPMALAGVALLCFGALALTTAIPPAFDIQGAEADAYRFIAAALRGAIIVLLGGYFIALPPLLARYTNTFRNFRRQMGQVRYLVLMVLLLLTALLPIKMVCRWSFNMNYFVSIPEYFFNF